MDGDCGHHGSHTRYEPTPSLINLGAVKVPLKDTLRLPISLTICSSCILYPFLTLNSSGSMLTLFFVPTAAGATYSPPSPVELNYSDTTSSIYPDRPIRPLPKRRLRSRLSSEVVDSILYPPATTLSKPLFQFPYDSPTYQRSETLSTAHSSEIKASLARQQGNGDAEIDNYQFRGAGNGSDDECSVGIARRYQGQRQKPGSVNNILRNGYALSKSDAAKYIKPPIPQSTASSGDSVDGYDSFENTNNKKKRKIPTSGSLGSHQSSLSADMAQMGISSAREIDVGQSESDSGVGHYYGSGNSAVPAVSSGTGISGAGRGRYGRAGTRCQNGRSPLGVSVNGSNTSQASRHLHHRRDYVPGSSAGIKGDIGLHSFIQVFASFSNL